MAKKDEITIRIGTEADTKGAKETAKSIDQLEKEVKDLQKALTAAPIGSKEFTRLAGEIKVTQAEMSKAEGEARKLGATIGQRNVGGAVLEFSRAFEDAQYGIRGVLNNLPGLIAMLGGSAGLAGVISIAAVAGTQLWERLSQSKGPEETIKNVDQVKNVIKTLGDELRKLRQEEADRESLNLVERYEQLKRGIESQTQSQIAGIEALKSRIQFERELAGIQKQSALTTISNQQALGAITPAQADAQRRQIESASSANDLQQQKQIDDAQIEANRIKLEAAKRERQAAEQAREAADLELKNRTEELATAKRQLLLRAALDQQLAQLERDLAASRRASDFSTGEGGFSAGGTSDNAQTIELQQSIDALRIEIAKNAPLSATGQEVDGKTTESPAARAVRQLVEGDLNKGIKSLDSLNSSFKTLDETAAAAARKITDAQSALEQSAAASAQSQQQRQATADAQAAAATRAQQEAALVTQTGKTQTDLSSLASQIQSVPELAPLVQQINAALADRILSAQELTDISTSIAQNERLIGTLGITILNNFRNQATQIDALVRKLNQIGSQQGKLNY